MEVQRINALAPPAYAQCVYAEAGESDIGRLMGQQLTKCCFTSEWVGRIRTRVHRERTSLNLFVWGAVIRMIGGGWGKYGMCDPTIAAHAQWISTNMRRLCECSGAGIFFLLVVAAAVSLD